MITEIIYQISKIYFMFVGLYYIYALLSGDTQLFLHVTGIFGLLFLLSNILWYTRGGK